MKTPVISVLTFAALVAFIAPHGEKPATSAGPVMVGSRSQAHLAAASAPESYGDEMALEREGDGHFYATVQVDTRDYRMLIDTGATAVALTAEDARNMGLDWDPNALTPVARGASGPVMGIPVTIDTMAVGDFEAHQVQALIIPDGLSVSLLGQSFLSHVPKVEIADDKLTLSN